MQGGLSRLQSTEHSLKLSLRLGQRSSKHGPWSLDQSHTRELVGNANF